MSHASPDAFARCIVQPLERSLCILSYENVWIEVEIFEVAQTWLGLKCLVCGRFCIGYSTRTPAVPFEYASSFMLPDLFYRRE